jgi:hypothetical protein
VSRRAAIWVVALALTGCRGSTGPDQSYQQAAAIYQQLYSTQLDDAYGDPRMDEVVALLRKVDPRSVDAQSAELMSGTIQRGREELARQRAEREKMAAAAAQSATASVGRIDPQQILAANAEADAGHVQDPFGPGASVAELNKQSGGCLTDSEPFTEQGTGVAGTVYRMSPTDSCKGKLPGLVGQIVLVVNGKIYRRLADPRPASPPAAANPPPARQPAAPARAAPPPGSAQPQVQLLYPGQPMPEGMVPAPQPGQQQ